MYYTTTALQQADLSEKREAAVEIRNALNIRLGKTSEDLKREEIRFLLKRL